MSNGILPTITNKTPPILQTNVIAPTTNKTPPVLQTNVIAPTTNNATPVLQSGTKARKVLTSRPDAAEYKDIYDKIQTRDVTVDLETGTSLVVILIGLILKNWYRKSGNDNN